MVQEQKGGIVRDVLIGGKKFAVRSLRRKERKEHALDELGFGRFFYEIPRTSENEIDKSAAERGMDLVLGLVFTQDQIDEIDMLGGQRGLNDAFAAIIKETYGAKDEEKNLPASGAGPQTASA